MAVDVVVVRVLSVVTVEVGVAATAGLEITVVASAIMVRRVNFMLSRGGILGVCWLGWLRESWLMSYYMWKIDGLDYGPLGVRKPFRQQKRRFEKGQVVVQLSSCEVGFAAHGSMFNDTSGIRWTIINVLRNSNSQHRGLIPLWIQLLIGWPESRFIGLD